MNSRDPGKMRMHPAAACGVLEIIWSISGSLLRIPKSGNSEAHIREKSRWTLKCKRIKSRMKAQLSMGRVLLPGGCLY